MNETMNKGMEYFCGGCYERWLAVARGEADSFMKPCHACDVMSAWGGSVKESARMVLEVWGPPVRALQGRDQVVFVCEPNVYAPRQKFTGREVKFVSIPLGPAAFREQQSKFLSDYIAHPTKEHWDLLHPAVQAML